MVKKRGGYQIFNEDCFATFKRIEDHSIDMIFCDPPYGTTSHKWDSVIPLAEMWTQLRRICKPRAAIVFTSSQPFTSILISSNIDMFRYCWVWEKSRPANYPLAKKQPLKYHEDICVFGVESPLYYPIKTKGQKKRTKGTNDGYSGFREGLNDDRYKTKPYVDFYPSSIIRVKNPNHNNTHPTQKPVELIEYLIKSYTKENELVMDFTMGSGSTGVACGNLHRRFIGCDNDTDNGYFQSARSRINRAFNNPMRGFEVA